MKKLLLGSIALTVFSISILLFQISCKKEATAQPPTGEVAVNQLGLIVFTKDFISTSSTTQKATEIWIANIDGSNQRKVPVNIPSDIYSIGEVRLSPNGKTIIFDAELKKSVSNNFINKTHIYSFSVDGTGLKSILDFDNEFVDDKNYSRPKLCSVN